MKVVVIGAGPNGLTAAATLKKAGAEVTLLEMRGAPGGRFEGEIPVLHDTSLVSPAVVQDLGLPISWTDAPIPHLPDGTALERPPSWSQFIDTWRPLIRSLCEEEAPDIGDEAPLWPLAMKALGLRKPGTATMMELLRRMPQNLHDLLSESFEDERQQALLMPSGLLGSWMGPISPTAGAGLLLVEALRGKEPEGGHQKLIEALAEAAPGITPGRVADILVEKGRVVGVDLYDGSGSLSQNWLPANAAPPIHRERLRIHADAVISCVGPVTTLRDLVHPRHLPDSLHADLGDIRSRGLVAKLHLRLSERLFAQDLIRTSDHPLDLERAFDHAKHRRLPMRPPLEVRHLQGGKAASVLLSCAAWDLDGGWTEEARNELQGRIVAELEHHAPGARDRIQAMELITPADLEQHWGLQQGNPFQVELAIDQLYVMRPLPRLARGETGITGLVLGSDGQHPGVGPTLIPGWLAAKRLLRG